jgi:hypothetical protein
LQSSIGRPLSSRSKSQILIFQVMPLFHYCDEYLKRYFWRHGSYIFQLICGFILRGWLDGPAVSAFRRVITEVKQRWSVIGWVTKNLLSRAPPCFARHVKPLVPAAFAGISTNPHWVLVVDYGPFFLCVIHKEGLCPSSGNINRLTMMMMILSLLLC